jgi:hypothetical protein
MIDKYNAVGVATNSYNKIYRYTGVDPASISRNIPI